MTFVKPRVRCFSCKRSNCLNKCMKNAIEGIDYVVCSLCGTRGKKICAHLKLKHGLTLKEYKARFPQASVITASILEDVKKNLSGRENWVSRMKKEDPEALKVKIKEMGKRVSEKILEDEPERERRSLLMKEITKTHKESFRKISSETAIRTSGRKDILEKRTENLRVWRKENPKDFYEKCTSKMIKYKSSKPEKALLLFLQTTYPEFNFKGSQVLVRQEFTTKTKRRQMDIMSQDKKIIVEYDGKVHFKNIPSWNQLPLVKIRDEEVNRLLSKDCLLIRVGYDQWRNGVFSDDCKNLLREILSNTLKYKSQVIKIGAVYED